MKTVFAILLLASTAHAQVVVNDNIRAQADLYSVGPPDDEELWLWISRTPDPNCVNVECQGFIGLDHDAGFVQSHDTYWFSAYVVHPGDLFSEPNGLFPVVIDDFRGRYNLEPVFVGDDFYLGLHGQWWAEDGSRSMVYGWVHLRDEAGALRMVENAMAYGHTGIIVGSAVAVAPEPGTLSLLALALAQWPRRRRPKESRP
jgi:hypothetical protein